MNRTVEGWHHMGYFGYSSKTQAEIEAETPAWFHDVAVFGLLSLVALPFIFG